MDVCNILVVEDDPPVRNLITTTLKAHGYRFLTAANGESALLEASSHNPEIILLDLGLPDMDGVDIIKKVRTWSNTPIIVISARSEDHDKVEALDAGADDYLTKPFLMQELLLRVQHLLQRAYRTELRRSRVLTLGDCTVNLQDAAVRRADGTTLALTATERALLQRLADDRGHIVTYDAVCEAVWGADYYGYENSLNVHIRHLREKIEPDPGHPQWLQTVRGIGYRLTGEV